VLLLHVERECKPEDRNEALYYAKLEEWDVVRDAATTLWRVLEYVRDEDFLLTKTVAGYPAAPSDSPQANPVVQTARAHVMFDGESLGTLPLSGVPSIQISRGVWDRVCLHLKQQDDVPVYRSFLLDAYYFATSGDPIRAIIMGCAAWETALKHFLISKGEKNVEREDLPDLRKRAEGLKGDSLFDPTEFNDQHPDPLTKLARLRNKLLHRGEKNFSNEDIVAMMLTVDAALGWLFPHEWDSKDLARSRTA
jgi:hypothetical protein